MEVKEFSKFELATIKRTAQNVNPMVSKKNKLKEKLQAIQEEIAMIDTMQEQWEAPIKTLTGGYTTEDLVEKIIDTDDRGNKTTKWMFRYPETIVPVSVDDKEQEETASEEAPSIDANVEEQRQAVYTPVNEPLESEDPFYPEHSSNEPSLD